MPANHVVSLTGVHGTVWVTTVVTTTQIECVVTAVVVGTEEIEAVQEDHRLHGHSVPVDHVGGKSYTTIQEVSTT